MNELQQKDPLGQLIQEGQFIGWTYRIDYEQAFVLTSDLWKAQARGVPHNCFLLATSLDPKKLVEAGDAAREIVLLRVVGSKPLPMEKELVQARIESLQEHKSPAAGRKFDGLAKNENLFGGLQCRIL